MTLRVTGLAWCLTVELAGSLRAEPAPATVNEQIRHIREVRAVSLSPDGHRVLATISDSTADGGTHHLWVLDTSGGAPRQISVSPAGEQGEDRGEWTPPSDAVFFVSRVKGVGRLYRTAIANPSAVRLSVREADRRMLLVRGGAGKDGAEPDLLDVRLSPDGRTLALTVQRPLNPAPGRGKGDDAVLVGSDTRKHVLLLAPADGGLCREVTFADDIKEVAWAPSGKMLAIVTGHDDDEAGPGGRLWLLPADKRTDPQRIDLAPDTLHAIAWSPDSGRIGMLAQCADDAPPGCSDVYLLDLAPRKLTNLSRGLEGSIPDGGLVVGDDGSIVTTASVGMTERIARFRPGGIDWFASSMPVVTGIGSNARRSGWAMLAGGPGTPMTAAVKTALGDPVSLLKTPPLLPEGWMSTPGVRVTWHNAGREIEGILYLHAKPSTDAMPLIVHVHGGPSNQFEDRLYPIVELLVAQGWAVLQSNPRGSAGYGAGFMAANKNDLGGEDFRDITAGIDAVAARYPIDQSRLAMVGYSYGGTMAALAAGKTDRFRAFVSGAPVIDQISEYGTEDSSWYDRWYFGKPWGQLEDAWRQSAIAGAGRVHTPMLLLQGEADESDPPGQSREMYRALRQSGADVRLVTYPREDHIELHHNFYGEPSREPWHGVDLRQRMIDFIAGAFGAVGR